MNPRCVENEMNMEQNMYYQGNYDNTMRGCNSQPIYECPTERVCERIIMHEVPHVIPINTKIVNRHVYRHTYTPCFTTSECDTCENIYDQCCKTSF